ncbi:MAG: shikimate dehydrogenase [Clostridia bacterium]|nr:shikimate dehydrogenase [Clostridia bacterium]
MKYGLIGERLGHSYSPEIHARLADYTYELCELPPEAVGPFMQEKEFSCINVTIPYKTTVMPYLDEIDEAAAAIGAVNTVKRVGDRLYGYNTDFAGLSDLIDRVGVPLAGRTVLILGSGGTAKTANAVCRARGAAEIITVGRTAREGVVSYEEAYAHYAHASYIINATPVGMYPNEDACPIDVTRFPHLAGLCDAIYNPLRTDLVQAARARGIPAEGGLYMLVAQAVHAVSIFTGKPVSREEAERVFYAVQQEKENIYLIGMPGSGKSTVGRALAAAMNRPFYDSDDEIVQADGRDIPTIFAEEGEQAFRDLEAAAIARLSQGVRGGVIATGGGAILRAENLHRMRRGGRIYFLDRALEHIRPTSDRPLSSNEDALARRYRERYPLYCAAADVRVATDEDIAHSVENIRKDFLFG